VLTYPFSDAKGNPGTGLVIVGVVVTASALPVTANAGESWLAGDTGHLWYFDGTNWHDGGQVKGPAGPRGSLYINDAPPVNPLPGDLWLHSTDMQLYVQYHDTSGADQWVNVVGSVGKTGAPGPQGPGGAAGAVGAVGPIGPVGVQGVDGVQGPIGVTGATGATGATGPAGAPGTDGSGVTIRGAGTWAQINALPAPVVSNMWILNAPDPAAPAHGTLPAALAGDGLVWGGAAWINVGQIRGPAGVAGPAGAAGAVGPAGGVGAPGPTGPAGVMGPTGAAGATGAIGPIGVPGAAGAAGLVGPAGATGAVGATGAPGADSTVVGPTGPVGPVGPAGTDGVDGVDGGIGEPGIDGAPGADSFVPGPQGAQGDPGPQGSIGLPGPTGVTGATGPIGPMGPIVVSADPNNVAILGTDGQIFVPHMPDFVGMTAAEYAALADKDPGTLYVING